MIDLNNVLKNSAPLEVHAHWDPIADSTYNLHKKSPESVELFDLSPHEPIREYKGEVFNAFLPPSTVPVGDVWELDSVWDIPPRITGQIIHRFARGQRFKLGATGNWFCEKGSTNTFLAKISVVPAENKETEERRGGKKFS